MLCPQCRDSPRNRINERAASPAVATRGREVAEEGRAQTCRGTSVPLPGVGGLGSCGWSAAAVPSSAGAFTATGQPPATPESERPGHPLFHRPESCPGAWLTPRTELLSPRPLDANGGTAASCCGLSSGWSWRPVHQRPSLPPTVPRPYLLTSYSGERGPVHRLRGVSA